ncbi:hypothetical protein J6590_076323 [Homalodisca vitripennis]|nr:hypothetical protein J6590_076323 [Homalodisca vitripennis]
MESSGSGTPLCWMFIKCSVNVLCLYNLQPGLIAYLLSDCSGAKVSASQDIVFCRLDQSLKLMRLNLEGESTIAAEEFRDSGFLGESEGKAEIPSLFLLNNAIGTPCFTQLKNEFCQVQQLFVTVGRRTTASVTRDSGTSP